LGDKISLNQKQLKFIKDILEINDSEEAVAMFMEIMLDERVDPSLISTVVDKIMKKMEKK